MSKRLEALQKMVASGTPDPFARYALAMEYRSLGRLEESLAAFGELREKDPAYVPQYLMAGGVAATLGRPEVAREIFEEGVRRAMAKGDSHTASEIQTALAALPSS